MLKDNPIRRFASWYREAVKRSPGPWFDPTAMTLATSDREGNVTARIVLLKKFGPEGFTFFTNYASRKGNQLAKNPRAALVMYWPYLHRQVRIEGSVTPVDREESEKYFHSRPRLYQLAGSISPQSSTIPSRKYLLDRFKRLREQLSGREVPLPETWGGYRVIPDVIEFWNHRNNRLHDRIRYKKTTRGWTSELLAP